MMGGSKCGALPWYCVCTYLFVLCALNQLPPPEGRFLADVPKRLKDPNGATAPDALAEYGRELLWGGAVQGVAELVQR